MSIGAFPAATAGISSPRLRGVRFVLLLLLLIAACGAATTTAWSNPVDDEDAGAEEEIVEPEDPTADDAVAAEEEVAAEDDVVAEDDTESAADAGADPEEDVDAAVAVEDDDDAAADTGVEDGADTDAGAAEVAAADDDSEMPLDEAEYLDGSTPEDEFMTVDWAPDVSADPTDDAVPFDAELDPSGLGWEVVPVAPARGQAQTTAVSDLAGRTEIFEMRPRRTAGPARPQAGATPARPARGTDDGGKDTAYSFGGQPIKRGSAPWQAQIYRSAAREKPGEPRWRAQHNCGGTLIAPGWILTAAHCIDDILDDREAGWRVRLGGEDLSKDDGVTYAVERWVRHSGYKKVAHPDPPKPPLPPPNMYANDIGLIRIKADAQTRPLADPKRVQPITLYRKPIKGGDEVTAIGWGMTQLAEKSFSAVPLKVDLQVMDTPVCQAREGYGPQRVNAGVICAAREGQKTCRGDSGGPVILTNGTTAQLVGLVSWGKRDCAGDGRPSVFTRLESHLSWIEQAMKLPETRASLP